MKTVAVNTKVTIQPLTGAPPAVLNLGVTSTYARKTENEYVFTAAQSNVRVNPATLPEPQLVIVQVESGTVSLSTDVSGANPWTLSMAGDPAPTNKSMLVMFNADPGAFTLYISSPGPATVFVGVYQ